MNYKKQTGTTLLVTLIFLLLISILGVSSMKNTLTKTQVSGNTITTMMAYQSAESILAHATKLSHIGKLSVNTQKYVLTDTQLPDQVNLERRANIEFSGKGKCPIILGMSTKFKCVFSKVNAFTQVKSTNARAHHTNGIAIVF